METLLCLTMFDTLSKFWWDPVIHNQDLVIKSKTGLALHFAVSLDNPFLTAFHHSAILQHAKWPHPVLGCSGQVAQHSCGRRFNHRPCWIATTKCYRAFCFKHLAFREIKQEFEGRIVKFKEHQRTSQFPQHPCLIVGGSGPWWLFKNPPTTDIIMSCSTLPLHVFAICLHQKFIKARCLHNSGLSKKNENVDVAQNYGFCMVLQPWFSSHKQKIANKMLITWVLAHLPVLGTGVSSPNNTSWVPTRVVRVSRWLMSCTIRSRKPTFYTFYIAFQVRMSKEKAVHRWIRGLDLSSQTWSNDFSFLWNPAQVSCASAELR